MKLNFSNIKNLLVALVFLGILTACGAGKGCDCPSFKIVTNLPIPNV